MKRRFKALRSIVPTFEARRLLMLIYRGRHFQMRSFRARRSPQAQLQGASLDGAYL